MEQNEQTAAAEATPTATTAETATAENNSEKTGGDANSNAGAEPVVTDRTAVIKIEGQELELEAALAQDDKMLKAVLQPYYSSVENATITRDVKEGKLTVTIVKKAQHKG